MKISIIGASQGTGALAVKAALERGHSVTAFARTPERLGTQHPHLTLLKGDFHRAESVTEAVRGQDAVIITAAASTLKGFRETSPKAVPFSISRADVADFLVEAATVDTWDHQAVQLGG